MRWREQPSKTQLDTDAATRTMRSQSMIGVDIAAPASKT